MSRNESVHVFKSELAGNYELILNAVRQALDVTEQNEPE